MHTACVRDLNEVGQPCGEHSARSFNLVALNGLLFKHDDVARVCKDAVVCLRANFILPCILIASVCTNADDLDKDGYDGGQCRVLRQCLDVENVLHRE